MLLLEVNMESIRGVPGGDRALKLSFQGKDQELPRWIVFAGRNGAGKSTLMQAVALAIAGPSVALRLAESFSGWIRDGDDQGSVAVKLRFSESDSFTTGRKPTFDPWTAIRWTRSNGPEPTVERLQGVGGRWTPDRGPWAENPRGWFLAGYGPFRRLSPAPSEALRLMMSPGRPAALASLFREDASLSESVQWLQQVYLQRLEDRGNAAELEKVVLAILDDGLLPEGMRVSHVDSQGLWVESPEGKTFPLTSLSDGYRTVAGLVLDLIRQIHAANGAIQYRQDGGEIQILQEGVVIVDEIDVHLHVEWQKRIGFWLKRHFPEMQFLVSTHSPFICQAADPGGLVRLSPPWEEGPAASLIAGESFNRVVNGSSDEALLGDLFGLESTLSDRATADRERMAQLEVAGIIGELTSEQKAALEEVAARIPRSAHTEQPLRLFDV